MPWYNGVVLMASCMTIFTIVLFGNPRIVDKCINIYMTTRFFVSMGIHIRSVSVINFISQGGFWFVLNWIHISMMPIMFINDNTKMAYGALYILFSFITTFGMNHCELLGGEDSQYIELWFTIFEFVCWTSLTTMMAIHFDNYKPKKIKKVKWQGVPGRKYTKKMITFENNTNCALCQEDFIEDDPVYKLTCGHVEHKECIDPWFAISVSCPRCNSETSVDES